SGGVASAIAANPGSIGYVGPDFALPSVTNTGTNTFGLNVAALKNAGGAFVEPTSASALAAFGSVLPPQSNSDGSFNASVTTNGLRNDPTAWVQSTAPPAALANPSGLTSYPIVG